MEVLPVSCTVALINSMVCVFCECTHVLQVARSGCAAWGYIFLFCQLGGSVGEDMEGVRKGKKDGKGAKAH